MHHCSNREKSSKFKEVYNITQECRRMSQTVNEIEIKRHEKIEIEKKSEQK